jgi:hypothetical protein
MSLPPYILYRLLTRLSMMVLLLSFSLLPAQTLTPVLPPPAAADSAAGALKADSAAAKRVMRADTARVVMHNFNHRQQLVTGGAIMATLVSIMVVMNNYNPRLPQ